MKLVTLWSKLSLGIQLLVALVLGVDVYKRQGYIQIILENSLT